MYLNLHIGGGQKSIKQAFSITKNDFYDKLKSNKFKKNNTIGAIMLALVAFYAFYAIASPINKILALKMSPLLLVGLRGSLAGVASSEFSVLLDEQFIKARIVIGVASIEVVDRVLHTY